MDDLEALDEVSSFLRDHPEVPPDDLLAMNGRIGYLVPTKGSRGKKQTFIPIVRDLNPKGAQLVVSAIKQVLGG